LCGLQSDRQNSFIQKASHIRQRCVNSAIILSLKSQEYWLDVAFEEIGRHSRVTAHEGWDIITVDKRSRVRAYQLKCGDFNHPGIPIQLKLDCFLVTNGEIKDPAIRAITSANVAWKKRKYPSLQTITKGRLLAVHRAYF
jgi:hypothetical protein